MAETILHNEPRPAASQPRPADVQWLAWIVESSLDMIIGETLDGVITSWNRRAEQVYLYSAEEAIGRRVDLIVPDDRRDELHDVLARLARGEEIDWFETVRRARNGTLIDISLRVSPVRDVSGQIVGASAIARDITERRRIERELDRERNAARQYLDIAGAMFVVIGADGHVELINQKGCQILGYREPEIVGADWFDRFVPSRERTAVRSMFESLMKGELGQVEYGENTVVTRDGEERTIAWHNALVRDADGAIIATVSSGEDVTERRAVEQALRASERQFRRAILDSPVPVMLHADDGSIIEISRAWTELVGYSREQMPTFDAWLALAYRERADDMRERTSRLFKLSGRRCEGEFVVETASGRRTIELFSAPVGVDATGRRLVMTGANDLTERRRLEREIIEISEQERRRIGRDLHDGLASHLSGIALLSRGLVNEAASGRPVRVEELEEIATLARQGAEQARALAHGLSPVALEPAGLGAALEELARTTEHISGINCTFERDASSPALAGEIVSQLYWIAREAVANAVKHSGARSIAIVLCHCAPSWTLSITDDGQGLDDGGTGNGLGIHIMRYRANIIGARLVIESSADGGVTVLCTLGDGDCS
jgi:PAS domain S-box-containing protein